MRYFPIFFDLLDRHVIVVGGGEEALRKIRLLLKTPAKISVIAPELHNELKSNSRVQWLAKTFTPQLLDGAALVYSAEPELNSTVSQAAIARGIPVNAVDQAEISTFIIPSIVDRDPVVIAIGTEGTAPVLAQGLRARIDAMLPAKLGALANRAASLRARVAASVPHGNVRRGFWQNFFFGNPREMLFAGDDVAFALAVNDAIHDAGNPTEGNISLVGIGSGDVELLTLKAQRKMIEADVIVFDQSIPVAVLEMARRDAVRIAAPQHLHEIEALVVAQAKAGQHVVRLFSGAEQNIQAHEEYVMLRAQGISANIVPGLLSQNTQDDMPFPVRQDLQDLILRSAA